MDRKNRHTFEKKTIIWTKFKEILEQKNGENVK